MIHDFLPKEQKKKIITLLINEAEIFKRLNPNQLTKNFSFTQNITFIILSFLWKQLGDYLEYDKYIVDRYLVENQLYKNIYELLRDIESPRRTRGDVNSSIGRIIINVDSISQKTFYHIYLVIKERHPSWATELMQRYLKKIRKPYDISGFIKILEGTTLPEEYVEKSLDKFLQYFSRDSYSHVFKADEFEVL